MKKGLTKYLAQQLKSIDHLLKKPANTYKPATFHKLRVSIKKLQSLLDLLAFFFKDFDRDKILKPLTPVFKQAGKIRELQIEETKLQKYFKENSLTAYKNILRNDITKQKKKFSLNLKTNRVKILKETNRVVLPYLQKITTKKVIDYFREIKNKIELETGMDLIKKDNNIHQVRKQLKHLHYIKEGSEIKDTGNLMRRNNLLVDLLGKWHDSRVIVRHFEKELSSNRIKLKERHQLENIKKKFVSREELLFNNIRSKLASSQRPTLRMKPGKKS